MLNTVADWSCELPAFQSISFSIIYGPNYVVPTMLNTLSPATLFELYQIHCPQLAIAGPLSFLCAISRVYTSVCILHVHVLMAICRGMYVFKRKMVPSVLWMA